MIRQFLHVITLFFAVAFAVSCHNNDTADTTERETVEESLLASPLTPVPVAGLNLNNGERWVVDAPTAANYSNLKQITDRFVETDGRDLESYHAYCMEMSEALNKLIQECRMEGADHDALHDWLEPVIKDVNDLKKSVDPLEAQKIFVSLNNRVQIFDSYFSHYQ